MEETDKAYVDMLERKVKTLEDGQVAKGLRIAKLEAALKLFYPRYGCPACVSDNCAANPPVTFCPMSTAELVLKIEV